MTSEDIGNADLRVLLLAWDVVRLGDPKGDLALVQAVIYMAYVAKSNAVYIAFILTMEKARSSGLLEMPIHLRNAPNLRETCATNGTGQCQATEAGI